MTHTCQSAYHRRWASKVAGALLALLLVGLTPLPPADAALSSSSSWSSPTRLGSSDLDEAPSTAASTDGTAIALWAVASGANQGLFASSRTADGEWSEPTRIDGTWGVTGQAKVGMDELGRAFAVWQGECTANCTADGMDGESDAIVAATYDPAGGWAAGVKINTGSGSVRHPALAVSMKGVAWFPPGNMLTAWEQNDGSGWSVWGGGAGAGAARRLETNTTQTAKYPSVGVSPDGDGIVAWTRPGSGSPEIWMNFFNFDAGWGAATQGGAPGGGAAGRPIALWYARMVFEQYDGADWNLYQWGAGHIGGPPLTVLNATVHPVEIATAVGKGGVLISWVGDGNVSAGFYDGDLNWSGTSALSGSGKASAPACTIDAYGNAVVVWLERNGTRDDVWSSLYNSTTGWGKPLLVEKDNGGSAFLPGVTSPLPETFVAVWQQGKDSNNSVMNVHTATLGGNATAAQAPLKARVDELAGELASLRATVASTSANISAIQANLTGLASAIATLDRETAQGAIGLENISASLNDTQLDLASAAKALDELNAAVAVDEQTIALLQALASAGALNDTEILASVIELRASSANLSASLDALRARFGGTETQLASAKANLTRLEAEVALQNSNGTAERPPTVVAAGGAELTTVVALAALAAAVAALLVAVRGRRRES